MFTIFIIFIWFCILKLLFDNQHKVKGTAESNVISFAGIGQKPKYWTHCNLDLTMVLDEKSKGLQSHLDTSSGNN